MKQPWTSPDSGIKVWKLRTSLRQAAERRGWDGPRMAPVKALRPHEEAPVDARRSQNTIFSDLTRTVCRLRRIIQKRSIIFMNISPLAHLLPCLFKAKSNRDAGSRVAGPLRGPEQAGRAKSRARRAGFEQRRHIARQIRERNGGKVTFHSDPLGDVNLSWDKIKELHVAGSSASSTKPVARAARRAAAQFPVGTIDVADQKLTVILRMPRPRAHSSSESAVHHGQRDAR
jgi:hypothetical protein